MDEIEVEPVDRVEDDAEAETAAETEPEPADSDPAGGIDVEVDVETSPAVADAPEYVLYGGKGGVGKTTMAAATGLASAEAGVETLVVSTDPAHSLSDTYEAVIGSEPTRLREDVPLYAVEIDPEAAMEEGATMFGAAGEGADPAGPMAGGPMGELLGEGEGFDLLGGTMPGADEAVAMQKLLEYLDDPRFERVVVDTAPTGHTLRLLELPELLDTMVGRMMRLRERMSGLFDGMKGMFGGEVPEEGSEDLEAVADRIERLRAVLQDPAKTDFRVVTVPEEMSVMEADRLIDRLGEYGIPVGTVVVNRVMEDLADVAEGIEPGAFVTPDVEHCAFCARRWEVQQRALGRAQELFIGHTVKRVPLLAEEVRGERALRIVAACLR